jgi:LemA protein
MMKNTKLIIVGVVVAIIALLGGVYVTSYNSIISLEEKVNTEYSNIESQLQRRADLIPNLISTVKGYMSHEEKIIKDITDARERISSASNISELSEANQQLSTALTNLNVIVENYPDLKANENFLNLQDELAGTENRVATARKDYNDAVKAYNTKIQTIPSNIIANMMGKQQREYFEVSDESKKDVPVVDFSE